MEIKGPKKESKVLASDLRLPTGEPETPRGPSRGMMMLHLAGIGLGLLLLVVGLGLGLSRNMWDRLSLIPVIAGGALLAGWITVNHRLLGSMIRNRRVMVGTNAVFMGMLGLALLILANYVSTRHYTKWDMTQQGLFTLSPKTENVLKSLDKDVAIVVFRMARLRTGEEETYVRLRDLLQLYIQSNPRIKIEYPQPDVDPESAKLMVSKYGIDVNWGIMADDVYVVSGQKKKLLKLNQLMQWEYFGDQFNPQRRPVAFKGEQFITSALIEVTEEKQTRLYMLTGHGERSVEDTSPQGMMSMVGLFKRDNIAVEPLSGIPVTGVPPDCDGLVILAPESPLSRDEVERIKRYLDKGGRLLVCEDTRKDSGLAVLLAEYGVKVGNDVVIATDPKTFHRSAATIFIQNFGSHDITKPLKDFRVLVDYARSITPIQGTPPRYKVTKLLETTLDAYAETDVDALYKTQQSQRDPAKDAAGPISIAVAVEEVDDRPAEEAAAPTRAKKLMRMVVVGDADMFANNFADQIAPNLDFCRNAVNWLVERKDLVTIESRPEMERVLVVDDSAKKAVFWLLVVALPLLVLLLGGVVWAMRSYGSRAK
jgi:ABC-type uncharacterized transport system involved in gliding motility auxiliary subunit